MNKPSDVTLRKVRKHTTDRDAYAAYVTPVEIKALVKAGARPNWDRLMEVVEEDIRKGECNPRWFYFTANKQLKSWLPTDHIPKRK